MICIIPEPTKISVYANTKWPYKTAAQVKAETGADVVINAGLYNLTSRELCQTQKINGEYLSLEDEPYAGYGWNGDGSDLKLTTDHAQHENFVSCINLPLEGALHYPDALGGVRGRVAFGVKADGSVVVYCSKDGTEDACTPEQLRAKMIAAGCASALMLDGGGTAQCIMPSGVIDSQRSPPTYICFWAKAYCVQVGAFWFKSGAEEYRKKLVADGYPGAWIVEKQ